MLKVEELPSVARIAKDLRLSEATIRIVLKKIEDNVDIGKYQPLLENYQLNVPIIDDLSRIQDRHLLKHYDLAEEMGISPENYRMHMMLLRQGKRPRTFLKRVEALLERYKSL